MNAPEWIRSFHGSRIVVQDDARDLVWTQSPAQAAQSLQQLAEGQEILKQKTGRSPWMIAVYVFAALFAVQLLFILLALGISLVAR
jgi:cytochrome b